MTNKQLQQLANRIAKNGRHNFKESGIVYAGKMYYGVSDGTRVLLTPVPVDGVTYGTAGTLSGAMEKVFLNDGIDLYGVQYKALKNMLKENKNAVVYFTVPAGRIYINGRYLKDVIDVCCNNGRGFMRLEYDNRQFRGGVYRGFIDMSAGAFRFPTLPVNSNGSGALCMDIDGGAVERYRDGVPAAETAETAPETAAETIPETAETAAAAADTPEAEPAALETAPAAAPETIDAETAAAPEKARGPVPEKTFIGTAIDGTGWKILFDGETDRTRVIFSREPSKAERAAVVNAGFYYSNKLQSFNKKLTWKAYRAALQLAETLRNLETAAA